MTRLLNWSSTENNNNNAYNVNFSSGNTNNNNKNNTYSVRAVRDFWQTDLFHQPIPLSDFYSAYADCRKNKRNTCNALAFEIDYERNLQDLYEEVNSARYAPLRSMAFIIKRPVQREVFAADFRDRIIHHLLILKLNDEFERSFIYDSYACRIGKGAHFAIRRADHFIRSCSQNYSKDCYVLKLDISGFFMSINRNLLWERLSKFVEEQYDGRDILVIKYLLNKTVMSDPTKNCYIKGSWRDWNGLPRTKSLFYSKKNCGLPIGNLTSQVFANFYMNPFDHFMKHDLHLRYYGRYVDDMIIVHEDIEYLKSIIPRIRNFLKNELGLSLHPNKIYLQHYSKGVKFLGCVIKPHRIYIANRTKGNLHEAVERFNNQMSILPYWSRMSLLQNFRSSMNSYLGILQHYDTYNIRKKEIYHHMSSRIFNRIEPKQYCRKIVLK